MTLSNTPTQRILTYFLVTFFILVSLCAQAQEFARAFNITNVGDAWTYTPSQTTSSDPLYRQTAAQLNGNLMVVGQTDSSGQELYRFDRFSATVSLVVDLEAGSDGSEPLNLTAVEDVLLFHAETAADGRELYRTDGTEEGTRMLELAPGPESSIVFNFSSSDKIFGVHDNLGFISARYADGTDPSLFRRLAIYNSRADSLIRFPDIFSPVQAIKIDSSYYVITSSADIYSVRADGSSTRLGFGPLGWYRKFGDRLMVSGRRHIAFFDPATSLIDTVYTTPNISTLADTVSFTSGNTIFFFAHHETFGSGELWRSDGTQAGTICLNVEPGPSGPIFLTDFISTQDGIFGIERVGQDYFLRSFDTVSNTFTALPASPAGEDILVSWNGAATYPTRSGGGFLFEFLPQRGNTRIVGGGVPPTARISTLYPVRDFLIGRAIGNPNAQHLIYYLDCDGSVNQEFIEVCSGESIEAFGRTLNSADTFIVNTPVVRGCDVVTTVFASLLDTISIEISGPDSITIGDPGQFVSNNGEIMWPDGSFSSSFELPADSLAQPGTYSFSVSVTDSLTGCTSEQTFEVVLVMPVSSTSDISSQFRIAPNPARTQVNLLGYQQGDQWTLFSTDGRRISQGTQAEVDMSTLPSGLYWIKSQRADAVGVRSVMLR